MLHRTHFRCLASSLLALNLAIPPVFAGTPPRHDKTIWSYEGGIFLEADGEIHEGQCFRMKGHVQAPDFFENLKEETTTSGFLFRRGNDIVTEFPKHLHLSVLIFDFPCSFGVYDNQPHVYLTDEAIRSINFHFLWKHELDMRPARGIKLESAEVRPIPRRNTEAAEKLPQRYEWSIEFDVPSEGVPLTDSLVLFVLGSDRHIITRTSARL